MTNLRTIYSEKRNIEANQKPIREFIYNKLVEYITNGEISPGEKLTESGLARHFGVSRTPVREALLKLEERGIINQFPNVGAVVRKITRNQIEDCFDLIAVLEGYAVETVVSNGIESQNISYLGNLKKEMEELAKLKNYFKYAGKDAEFHSFFVKKTKNELLSRIVGELRGRIYTVGLTLPFFINKYLERHASIIKAVAKGDPDEAGKLMREHVKEIKIFLIETLEKFREIPISYIENMGRE